MLISYIAPLDFQTNAFGCFVTIRGFSAFDFAPEAWIKVLADRRPIPHSCMPSNGNFLLFFSPWSLRTVLRSGMSYPLSAAFGYNLSNPPPFVPCCLSCFLLRTCFLMGNTSISSERLTILMGYFCYEECLCTYHIHYKSYRNAHLKEKFCHHASSLLKNQKVFWKLSQWILMEFNRCPRCLVTNVLHKKSCVRQNKVCFKSNTFPWEYW